MFYYHPLQCTAVTKSASLSQRDTAQDGYINICVYYLTIYICAHTGNNHFSQALHYPTSLVYKQIPKAVEEYCRVLCNNNWLAIPLSAHGIPCCPSVVPRFLPLLVLS